MRRLKCLLNDRALNALNLDSNSDYFFFVLKHVQQFDLRRNHSHMKIYADFHDNKLKCAQYIYIIFELVTATCKRLAYRLQICFTLKVKIK